MNRIKILAVALLIPAFAAFGQDLSRPHVLMISIDGMRPDYVTQADQHHLQIPNLRRFITEGTYAEGVHGVLPTVTYPSHTTMITGVAPLKHGIFSNTTFDPLNEHPSEWYWYFNEIKARTLYQAASESGLKTAAVSWPVTVGAPIDYLIAEIPNLAIDRVEDPHGHLVFPADLQSQLAVVVPPKATKDEEVTAWSAGIIQKFKPNLMLIHISNLDHEQHKYGPFTPQVSDALEVIDAQIGVLMRTELTADPKAKIVIVSDHGFVVVHHAVNLNVLFAQAGLMRLKSAVANSKSSVQITSWDAATWTSGGTAAVVLRDPHDSGAISKVKKLLADLQDDPQYGIDKVLSHEEIVKERGNPLASFMIEFKPGWFADNSYVGPAVQPASKTLGTHGYDPGIRELRSTFMVLGDGIEAHRDLGVIDMRQIAPTVAELLGTRLPQAELKPVALKGVPIESKR
jgi:predicted AlkP superfamily pyrophosphatase or phosphodiesterase